jgi:Family of unknown function (DUF6260)
MLRFTTEQELAVNSAREAFNAQQSSEAMRQAVQMAMVGNASAVPIDAWRRIDQRAALIQRDILQVFNKLSAANQTPVSIGDIVSFFPQVSDSGEVHVSMDGRSEGRADAPNVKYSGTPVPIFDSQARFGWRQMAVAQKSPFSLDTVAVGNHQRKVAEKLEDMALNGLSSIVVGGATIYGLRTFPQRNTGTHGLTLVSSTGAQWVAAFKGMVNLLIGDNAFGKVTVFLNFSDWYYAANTEYTANYPKKILTVLLEDQQIAEVVACSKVPANEIIGVADIGMGEWGTVLSAMPLTTRPKARLNPEDDYTFGVLAAAATQFRSDYDGRSTIAHLTTA